MTAHSNVRGHPTYFDPVSEGWRYQDNGVLVVDNWKKRPCGKCGEFPTPEGHDHCLGTLPGVMYACCGHGVEGSAYVKLNDG